MARMVEGVVRQQPPTSLAPELRHLVAKTSNLSSPKHFDGCQPNHRNKLNNRSNFRMRCMFVCEREGKVSGESSICRTPM